MSQKVNPDEVMIEALRQVGEKVAPNGPIFGSSGRE